MNAYRTAPVVLSSDLWFLLYPLTCVTLAYISCLASWTRKDFYRLEYGKYVFILITVCGFLWYCTHWAFKGIYIMCMVERQKIEGKWSQHKYFRSHGEQISWRAVYCMCSSASETVLLPQCTFFKLLHTFSTLILFQNIFQKCFPSLMILQVKF